MRRRARTGTGLELTGGASSTGLSAYQAVVVLRLGSQRNREIPRPPIAGLLATCRRSCLFSP